MKFGLAIFPTDYSIDIRELARATEAAGVESLWVAEHTHIPAGRQTPWPGGADLPPEYWHVMDPFVALAAAGAVTSELKLGFGICLVPQRDPIVTAKQVASLDHISGGRVLFGIGAGWNREEIANHGTEYRTRWSLMRERVLAMKEIWTQEEAQFHGRYVDFDPIWSYPKPVQKPHPPILMGGDGPKTFERLLDYADGWMPIVGRTEDDLKSKVDRLQRLAAEAGRAPIPVGVYAIGTPRPETIEEYAAAGVERCVFTLPPRDAADVLPRVERYAEVFAPYR